MAVIKIFSQVSGRIAHLIYRPEEPESGSDFFRENVIPHEEFLQLAFIRMPKDHSFPPHLHVERIEEERRSVAQESWVVIRGLVKAYLYDVDESLLSEQILSQGDASISLRGGHTYEALESHTMVYEFKTGPYYGELLDKRRF